jgi:hypothetical protein
MAKMTGTARWARPRNSVAMASGRSSCTMPSVRQRQRRANERTRMYLVVGRVDDAHHMDVVARLKTAIQLAQAAIQCGSQSRLAHAEHRPRPAGRCAPAAAAARRCGRHCRRRPRRRCLALWCNSDVQGRPSPVRRDGRVKRWPGHLETLSCRPAQGVRALVGQRALAGSGLTTAVKALVARSLHRPGQRRLARTGHAHQMQVNCSGAAPRPVRQAGDAGRQHALMPPRSGAGAQPC